MKSTASTSHRILLELSHTHVDLFSIDIQPALLPINLLIIRMKAKLPNHKPPRDESDRPQSKVHVDAADLAHDLHTGQSILKALVVSNLPR
jgi:hypothetical protein